MFIYLREKEIDEAKNLIDQRAEIERQKYITPGYGQAAIYRAKSAEAKLILRDPRPDSSKYPLLSAEVGLTRNSLIEMAEHISAIESTWMTIAAAIELARLTAKNQLSAATSMSEIEDIVNRVSWP